MGRKAEAGIIYYTMKCNHLFNKKIRLLFNEFDSDFYWIWQSLLSESYRIKGYYFDYNDRDAVELFASDVLKKKVSLVDEVVNGCVRRGLFDKAVFDAFGILTSAHMQEFYLDATSERRRKGTTVEFVKDFLLITINEESKNVSIVPWNEEIVPRNNLEIPCNNQQSKVKDSKVKDIEPKGSSGGEPPFKPPDPEKALKEEYSNLEKTKGNIYRFIRDKKPKNIQPYIDFWNFFAKQNDKPQVEIINEDRKKKFNKRLSEKGFDFIEILRKAQASNFIISGEGKWFCIDWIIKNEKNYLKVLEGNYDNGKEIKHEENDSYKDTRKREEEAALKEQYD